MATASPSRLRRQAQVFPELNVLFSQPMLVAGRADNQATSQPTTPTVSPNIAAPLRTAPRKGESYFGAALTPSATTITQRGSEQSKRSLRLRLGQLFSGSETILTGLLGQGTERQTVLGAG
jgi:hypothetical protein